jgi:hypothetical protein
MNNGLHEVISAAVQDAARKAGVEGSRPIPQLRTLETNQPAVPGTGLSVHAPAEPGLGLVSRLRRRAASIADEDARDDDINDSQRMDAGSTVTFAAGPRSTVAKPAEQHESITTRPATRASPRIGVTPMNVSLNFSDASAQLGPRGLRLAFWLCGFHDALMERRRRGEALTESEELLVNLSSADLVGMRPFVVEMTLGRLHGVVNAPGLLKDAEATGPSSPGPMEVFALTTLRNLSQRACQALQEEGPEAALGLFGEAGCTLEPLAIFQLVFTAALDLVEAFERMIPTKAKLLVRLADALDSEVEKI